MTTKELIVVGGPNGAGKTTFAEEYVARHGCNYVGADAIAAQLSPDDPTNAQFAASREFLRQIDTAIAGSDSLLSNQLCPDAHFNINCTTPRPPDSRPRLSICSWIPQTLASIALTNAFRQVATMFPKPIFVADLHAASITSGTCIVRWRITGY